jgi:hypothetical protein
MVLIGIKCQPGKVEKQQCPAIIEEDSLNGEEIPQKPKGGFSYVL